MSINMTQPVIKWTGSKRSQAKDIVALMPRDYNTYYEPFIGGGSVLYEVSREHGNHAICSDICEPLIDLWNFVKREPEMLYKSYKYHWEQFQKNEDYYYEVRDDFNKTKDALAFFFLTRTCINGKIRFNKQGNFNSAVHHKRSGINPETMKKIILDWSDKIKNSSFIRCDYKNIAEYVNSDDFVYLDPPYFNTKGMYYGGIDYDEFISFLRQLCDKGVRYILSYDGIRGDDNKIVDLPSDVYKRHELLLSGDSSFDRFKGEKKTVYESVYMNYE